MHTVGIMVVKDNVRKNSSNDLVVHEGSDVSNGTQPEEERMQGDQIIEHLNNLMLR